MLETPERTRAATTVTDLENSVLISFPICPFVARARIVALEKGIDIKVKFIDLTNKPKWFLERSPTGTVPALDTGTHFIFESSVISEFIDETSHGTLHPAATSDRAVSRAWTEYAVKLLMPQYNMMTCGSQAELDQNRSAFLAAMAKVENAIASGPFFNGQDFAIVDAAYAPIFVRTRFLLTTYGIDLLANVPKLRAWGNALLERPSVQKIHGPEHYDQLKDHMSTRGSILLN